MPGTANLGDNLVDSLLDVVDDLRGDLHPAMGVRQWRVFIRRRTWDGARRGEGSYTDQDVELTPQPLVEFDLKNELKPAGLEETGPVVLTEVSLTYTEAELTGQPIAANEAVFYILRDAHGQAMGDRFFQIAKPPHPDRINTIGWVITLSRADVEDC